MVTRASATVSRPLKKMRVCSSTEARPAICAFLQKAGEGGEMAVRRGMASAVASYNPKQAGCGESAASAALQGKR